MKNLSTKKKILYFNGHARYSREYGTVGEIIKRLQEDSNNEIFYLDCNNAISGYCWLTKSYHMFYCKKCLKNCREILKKINLDEKYHLKMKKYKKVSFPEFKSIQEILNYEYKGYKIGFGTISTMMTATRDYNFDVKKYKKYIIKFLENSCIVLDNILDLQEKYDFDEIHFFNGRFSINYPFLLLAQKYNLPYTTYEHGSKINKILILKNTVPHDFYSLKERIKNTWNNADINKFNLAEKWFKDRRSGKYQAMSSFTKDQTRNLLPQNWDNRKENIVIFNSSMDEIYAFDSWKVNYFETENEILKKILEKYKEDSTKHFYLRIHPNLTRAKKNNTTQIQEINKIKEIFKNLTVIEPNDKIDSYALVDAADKILVGYSTLGCEATYWGNVSILYGKSPYEDFDCVYKAHSFNELLELIETKNLKPKPKENTYAYAYYNEIFGEKYRYYNVINQKEGEFFGLKFSDK